MTIDYETHNQQQGQGSAKTAQGSGYQHLWWQICRPTADAPGKSGILRRRTRRRTRSKARYHLYLGARAFCATRRCFPENCRSFWLQKSTRYTARKVDGGNYTNDRIPPIASFYIDCIISPVINFVGDSTSPFAVPCARKLITKQAHRERHFYVQT